MVSFPNCKVNLGLHIVEKRPDGYHNLETVFYPIPLHDVLEIITADPKTAIAKESESHTGITFSMSGLPVAGDPTSNLCVKAWHLLKADFPDLPAEKLHLHKNIPMGAGLGGGSSDGAATLSILNKKFSLSISDDQLAAYALQLGSDCPFFVYNKPMFATGRGEISEPLALDLGRYYFLIINPGIHISTAQAFSRIKPVAPPVRLSKAVLQPLGTWKETVLNDFEEHAFFYHPELRSVKKWLYGAGAVYASMTGTGSCFYGIFEGPLPGDISLRPGFDSGWQHWSVPAAKL